MEHALVTRIALPPLFIGLQLLDVRQQPFWGVALHAIVVSFLIGMATTIAVAYEYDSSSGRMVNGLPTTTGNGGAPLVNWDVLTDDCRYVQAVLRTKVEDLKRKL